MPKHSISAAFALKGSRFDWLVLFSTTDYFTIFGSPDFSGKMSFRTK